MVKNKDKGKVKLKYKKYKFIEYSVKAFSNINAKIEDLMVEFDEKIKKNPKTNKNLYFIK
jgi:hypothetical protein